MLIPMLVWLMVGFATVGETPIEPVSARRQVVEMRDFEFQPNVVRVTAGDTIVWLNRDVVPHTATAKPQWDTGTIAAKATGSWAARGKDEVTYECVFHPGMVGKIVFE